VLAFMHEVERDLWRLGVPVKTRHNEVAPSQYELAPVFERTTVAADHNMLTMEVMKQVALRHGFQCLLHEKPFAGINGSGKHNNWSMATDRGENLLDPGHTPAANMRFVVFLTAVIRAVDAHADLLRVSIAHAGNDHRLGANEAPPAIISIYLGEQLTEVVQALVAGAGRADNKSGTAGSSRTLRLGVTTLPPLPRDATDRNRTSPFAFTGNKFEFRAVGSSQAIARPNMMLNAIVADALAFMADEIGKLKQTMGLEAAVQQVVQATLKQHQRVVFNGNNYSTEWQDEAGRRGLPNFRNAVDAIANYCSPKNLALFEKHGVLSAKEAESRQHVMFEAYSKSIAIEAQTALSMASTMILPAAVRHQQQVAASIAAAKAAGAGPLAQQERALKTTVTRIEAAQSAVEDLQRAFDAAEQGHNGPRDHATVFRNTVVPAIAKLRESCDALEQIVDDELWPLPKYREMLFVH
jgi:glutamine synthetase